MHYQQTSIERVLKDSVCKILTSKHPTSSDSTLSIFERKSTYFIKYSEFMNPIMEGTDAFELKFRNSLHCNSLFVYPLVYSTLNFKWFTLSSSGVKLKVTDIIEYSK